MTLKKLLRVFILLLIVSALPSVIVWLRHKIVFELHPLLGSFFFFVIVLNTIPVFIIYYSWLKKSWFKNARDESFTLFGVAALCWLIGWMLSGKNTLDFHLHDTYYIFSFSSIFLCTALLFVSCAVVYYLFSRLSGRYSNIFLARIHFWVSFIALNILLATRYPGLSPDIHQYVEIPNYGHFIYFNRMTVICLLLFFIAQGIFLFNIIYSFTKPRHSLRSDL